MYHVTRTSAVPKIKAEGLKTGQKANWSVAASGKKYGKGEVYAFDHPRDAMRWAARMDWEQNKGTGTGKISIVQIRRNDHKWEEDTNDPLSHIGSRGTWWKTDKSIPAKDILNSEQFTTKQAKELIT